MNSDTNHRHGPRALTGEGQWKTLPLGQATAGTSVGILCIPGVAALLPGNVQNASTWDFPVAYEVLHDVVFAQIARGDEQVIPALIDGARRLVDRGCRAVVGACGSFGHYQEAVAAAVSVPVYMSILTQVPFILQALGPNQHLLVIFATTRAFTAKVQKQCGMHDTSRVVAVGLEDCPEFGKMSQPDTVFDVCEMERQVIEKVAPLVTPAVGGIVLQCSDLPPFAAALQRRFGLPVHDMTVLVRWLHDCVVRRPFSGWM